MTFPPTLGDPCSAKGWPWFELGKVCRTTSGGTPSRKNSDYFGGEVPWVKSGELPDGPVLEIEESITEVALAASSAKLLPAGTLLMALYGATVGKLGVLAKPAATNQAVCALFPSAGLETKFLFWFLRFRRPHLVAIAVGGAQPNISQGLVRSLLVPVPAASIQRLVVAEIEKQFSRLDEAVANLQRVQANLRRQRASILASAMTGCLVAGMEHERWSVAEIGSVAKVISGLTKSPKREALPRKMPYLRVANVYANELRLGQIETIGVADNEVEKLLVRKGDLLVVEGNGSPDQIGRVAMWDGSIPDCVHQNHLIKVRFGAAVMPQWALMWLLSPSGRREIENVSSSTSGLHTLSTGKVSQLPIPVPPLEVQRILIDEVDRRLSIVRGVEAQVEANLKRAQALRQAVLAKAFAI